MPDPQQGWGADFQNDLSEFLREHAEQPTAIPMPAREAAWLANSLDSLEPLVEVQIIPDMHEPPPERRKSFTGKLGMDYELPVTVGFELEFARTEMRTLGSNFSGTPWEGEDTVPGWTLKTDSSCGWELVSPVIHTSNSLFDHLWAVTGILHKYNSKVDRRCGLHVHLGMVNEYTTDVSRMLRFFARYEEVFMSLVPLHRRMNSFCQPLSMNTRMGMVEHYDQATKAWDSHVVAPTTRANGRPQHRYQWLNCSRFEEIGTVEVRLMEGTLDPSEIAGWVLFLAFAAGSVLRGNLDFTAKKSPSHIEVMVNNFLFQTGFSDKNALPIITQTRKWLNNRFKRVNGFSYKTRLNQRYPSK